MDLSNQASPLPWMQLETLRGDDGRSIMRLRTLPPAGAMYTGRPEEQKSEVLPAGLSLPWVFGLDVYRAEQRVGLVQV